VKLEQLHKKTFRWNSKKGSQHSHRLAKICK